MFFGSHRVPWKLSLLPLFIGASATVSSKSDIKTYEINLDLPPHERWTEVISEYKPLLMEIKDWMTQTQVPPKILPELTFALNLAHDVFPKSLQIREELEGVAKAMDTPVGQVLLMNLFYELLPGCTSIVAQNDDGSIWHGRNLDFFIPHLRDIAINVVFIKEGNELYRGTTFAGYIGVPTGMKRGAFSVSQDARGTPENPTVYLLHNIFEWIFKGGKAYSFFLRDVLENAADYEHALKLFQETPMIAPCYLILAGSGPGEGAVVTRSRKSAVDTWKIQGNRWFLVQTNDDHFGPPADKRRDAANELMEEYSSSTISAKSIYTVMNTGPIKNRGTVTSSVINAKQGYFFSMRQNVSNETLLSSKEDMSGVSIPKKQLRAR